MQIAWSQSQQLALAAALQELVDGRGRFRAHPGGLMASLDDSAVRELQAALDTVFLVDLPLAWAACQAVVGTWSQGPPTSEPSRLPSTGSARPPGPDPVPVQWLRGLQWILSGRAVSDSAEPMPLDTLSPPPQFANWARATDPCLVTRGCDLARQLPIAQEPVDLLVPAPESGTPLFETLQRSLIQQIHLILERWLFEVRVEQEKLAALKRLAYGASHEINNPLANIATRAQTLLVDEHHPRRRQSLETINAQAFRAYDMLANLMHFAAPPNPQFQTIDLVALTQKTLREFTGHFPDLPTGHLVADVPDHPLRAEADPVQLATMLHAILRNAAEATDGTGPIQLQLRETGHPVEQRPAAQWTVSDDGPPVPPASLATFCDPFHSGREAGRGLGFGLSKALRVVEAHRGGLELIPGQPRGLIVRITLPLSS